MQNWHIEHAFKVECITHSQMKFHFPLINTNMLVSSRSLGILTLKGEKETLMWGESKQILGLLLDSALKKHPHKVCFNT